MLKVNTKKISVQDFIIKYHLFPVIGGTWYTTLNKGSGTIKVRADLRLVFVETDVDYGDSEATLDDDTLNNLFDMIQNGDVIKEEAK